MSIVLDIQHIHKTFNLGTLDACLLYTSDAADEEDV